MPGSHSQLPVDVKSLVGLELHLPHALAGHDALAVLQRRLELVAPRTPPAVAIAIVVAAQEVALGLAAALHGERHVDGLEQVFGERGGELAEAVDVLGRVLGVEAAEEVPGRGVSSSARSFRDGGRTDRALSKGSAEDIVGGFGALEGRRGAVVVVVRDARGELAWGAAAADRCLSWPLEKQLELRTDNPRAPLPQPRGMEGTLSPLFVKNARQCSIDVIPHIIRHARTMDNRFRSIRLY